MPQTIIVGDCRKLLADMPERSVHCVVTSPPYWGLRKYASDDPDCIGLEPTLDLYLGHMLEVFAAVHRVLRDDGTLWLNLGDAYASNGPCGGGSPVDNATDGRGPRPAKGRPTDRDARLAMSWRVPDGIAAKQLIGIPWRVAFALQTAGWWLRSDIIWHKPSPMPESVTDRPTKAHEYVFLMAKAARYFYDADAVREPSSAATIERDKYTRVIPGEDAPYAVQHDHETLSNPGGRNLRDVWTIASQGFNGVSLDGSYRITSPDCPDHGCLACLARALRYGGLRGAFRSVRNLGTDDSLSQVREDAVISIDASRCALPYGATSAISHSTLIRKMASVLEPDATCDDIPLFRTRCMRLVDHSCATSGHIVGSKIWADFSSSVTGFHPSEQTTSRIVGIADFSLRSPSCTCIYTGRSKKRQDHFALFPEKLASTCILAGTSSRGVCPTCGTPWKRTVEKSDEVPVNHRGSRFDTGKTSVQALGNPPQSGERFANRATGWQAQCDHGGEPIPATVLDPFAGAGTTGVVCKRMGLNFIGCEISEAYADMARRRIADPDAARPVADVPGQETLFGG